MIDEKQIKEMEDEFFEICERFGVAHVAKFMGYSSRQTIYHWIKNKEIPLSAYKKVNKVIRKARSHDSQKLT